jgi:hypothetical protein
VRVVEWASKVSLGTACILLGEHDAEIEAEWERVRGEADILYPGPPPPLSLSQPPLRFSPRLAQAELACIYEFPEAYCTRWRSPRMPADRSNRRHSAPYNAHGALTGLGLLDLALAPTVLLPGYQLLVISTDASFSSVLSTQ